MSSNAAPQRGSSFGEDIKAWWVSLPIAFKSILVTCTTITLAQLFGIHTMEYLFCSPQLIINLELWRLVTAQFANDIISLIFGLLSLNQSALMLERSIGSIYFFLDFMFKNGMIQVLTFVIIMILHVTTGASIETPSYGLFTTVILYMSLRSFSDPESNSNFLCFPIQIKNKYQPFAILVFFSLLSGQIRFDFVAAVIIGYIEATYFGGMILRLSPERLASLKASIVFKCFVSSPTFVDSNGEMLQVTRNETTFGTGATSQPSSFSGRGVTIGGAPSNAPNASTQQNRSAVSSSHPQTSQTNNQSEGNNVFAGKGISIGGQKQTAPQLTPQQQRELQLKRFKDEQQNESTNGYEVGTEAGQDSQDNSQQNEPQKQVTKSNGYSALSEDLL